MLHPPFVDEVTGEELHKKTMPYDENISMLLSLSSEYFEKAQPALLQIIQ